MGVCKKESCGGKTAKGRKTGCIACPHCCKLETDLLCTNCVKGNVTWAEGPWTASCPNCGEEWTPEYLDRVLTTDTARKLGLNAFLNSRKGLRAAPAPAGHRDDDARSTSSRRSTRSRSSVVSQQEMTATSQRAEQRAESLRSGRSNRSIGSTQVLAEPVHDGARRNRADSTESATQEGLTAANIAHLQEAYQRLAHDSSHYETKQEDEPMQEDETTVTDNEEEDAASAVSPSTQVDKSLFRKLAHCSAEEFGVYIRNNLINVLEEDIKSHPNRQQRSEFLEMLEKARMEHQVLLASSTPRIQQSQMEVEDRRIAIERAMNLISKAKAEMEEHLTTIQAEKTCIADSESRLQSLEQKAKVAGSTDPLLARLERNLADLQLEKELLDDRSTRPRRS